MRRSAFCQSSIIRTYTSTGGGLAIECRAERPYQVIKLGGDARIEPRGANVRVYVGLFGSDTLQRGFQA